MLETSTQDKWFDASPLPFHFSNEKKWPVELCMCSQNSLNENTEVMQFVHLPTYNKTYMNRNHGAMQPTQSNWIVCVLLMLCHQSCGSKQPKPHVRRACRDRTGQSTHALSLSLIAVISLRMTMLLTVLSSQDPAGLPTNIYIYHHNMIMHVYQSLPWQLIHHAEIRGCPNDISRYSMSRVRMFLQRVLLLRVSRTERCDVARDMPEVMKPMNCNGNCGASDGQVWR
jgi:hypothetical protein